MLSERHSRATGWVQTTELFENQTKGPVRPVVWQRHSLPKWCPSLMAKDSHRGRRELTPESCPLTSTRPPNMYVCLLRQTPINTSKKRKENRILPNASGNKGCLMLGMKKNVNRAEDINNRLSVHLEMRMDKQKDVDLHLEGKSWQCDVRRQNGDTRSHSCLQRR